MPGCPFTHDVGMWLIRIVGYLLGVTFGLGLPGVWTGMLWTMASAGYF